MTDNYREKFEAGLSFQDFIADQLRKSEPCIVLVSYSSQKYQNEHGENANGIEIKFDNKVNETGNLYFEVEEKTDPSIRNFTPSGIMRNDNTWLYLIGNYKRAWLFSKKQLQAVFKDKECWKSYGIKDAGNETSNGFTIPTKNVNRICLQKYVFTEDTA